MGSFAGEYRRQDTSLPAPRYRISGIPAFGGIAQPDSVF